MTEYELKYSKKDLIEVEVTCLKCFKKFKVLLRELLIKKCPHCNKVKVIE